MTNYMICDGHGNALTAGVQEHEIERMAQRIADERGETVYYSATWDGSDDDQPEGFDDSDNEVQPS